MELVVLIEFVLVELIGEKIGFKKNCRTRDRNEIMKSCDHSNSTIHQTTSHAIRCNQLQSVAIGFSQ